jgi:hypothetical protein
MQLTKLVAAPERQGKVPPRARAGQLGAGTASQLIRRVRRTLVEEGRASTGGALDGLPSLQVSESAHREAV